MGLGRDIRVPVVPGVEQAVRGGLDERVGGTEVRDVGRGRRIARDVAARYLAEVRILAIRDDVELRLLRRVQHHVGDAFGLVEAIELVDLGVEHQHGRRGHSLRELEGERLVDLEHGDVSIDTSEHGRFSQDRRRDSLRQIGARRVGEDLHAVCAQHLCEHVRRRRLAVAAEYVDDPVSELRRHVLEEPRREPRRDVAREGRSAAAKLRDCTDGFTRDDGDEVLRAACVLGQGAGYSR